MYRKITTCLSNFALVQSLSVKNEPNSQGANNFAEINSVASQESGDLIWDDEVLCKSWVAVQDRSLKKNSCDFDSGIPVEFESLDTSTIPELRNYADENDLDGFVILDD